MPYNVMQRLGDEDDEANGKEVEMGNLLESETGQNYQPQRYSPKTTFSTTSVFARTPVKSTEGYEQLMLQERSLFLVWFFIFVVISPLVFRYAMGSNIVNDTQSITLSNIDNASLYSITNWEECIECRNVFGVTLYNLTVIANNVTSPNPNGKTPSLALFASQDFENWYSLYTPKKLADAYISSWHSTTFEIFNGTGLGCLGSVYPNYLVICMNTGDLFSQYNLGDKVEGPPFNDRCFQIDGLCGIPCVSSVGMVYQKGCLDGKIDIDLLVSNETRTFDIESVTSVWMSGINWVEWVVLITIFFDCFGNLLRYLPVLSGRPTELESARNCLCEGITVLGCTSPFVSEDEAIFLRSLIGRTATVFHTVGGRHNMHGMYLDTILNEKRGKGETNRKHLWESWMEFVTLLARIGSEDYQDDGFDDYDEEEDEDVYEDDRKHNYHRSGTGESATQRTGEESGTTGESRPRKSSMINRQVSAASTHVTRGGERRGSRATLSAVPQNIRGTLNDLHSMTVTGDKPIAGADIGSLRVNSTEVVNFDKRTRSSTIGGAVARPSFRNHEIFARMSQATARNTIGERKSLGGLRMPNIPRVDNVDEEYEEEYEWEGEPREIDPFDPEEDLEFDMTDLLPLICFLDGWLEAIKDKEWTYNYRKLR